MQPNLYHIEPSHTLIGYACWNKTQNEWVTQVGKTRFTVYQSEAKCLSVARQTGYTNKHDKLEAIPLYRSNLEEM